MYPYIHMVETQISQNNICGVYETLPFLFHSFLLEKKKKVLILATTSLILCPVDGWLRLQCAVHCNPFSLLEASWAFPYGPGVRQQTGSFQSSRNTKIESKERYKDKMATKSIGGHVHFVLRTPMYVAFIIPIQFL